MFRYIKYKAIVTPSGGSVAWNTNHLTGDLVSIHVKPTTGSTTYTFTVVDPDGLDIYSSEAGYAGELSESYNNEVIDEIMTCTISSASVDEAFTVVLRFRVDTQNRG